ncbi:MAG: hypothetical protein ACWGQW_07020 [bacterium]
MSVEKRFQEIAQDMIYQANSVKCSIEEYIDGLLEIRELIDDSLDAAKMDLEDSKNG